MVCPPHRLKLKEFASIILLRNLDSAQGSCNGTRLTVRSFTKHLIDAEIATGIHAGTRVFIARIPLLTPSDSGLPFILKRRQFPVRPAFCITINKGQDQSLETVGISSLPLEPYSAIVNSMWLSVAFRIRAV